MYRDTEMLIMYGNISAESILVRIGETIRLIKGDRAMMDQSFYMRLIYDQLYRLLDLATRYGFDNNLWHCYIAYLLAMNENPYSIICERANTESDQEKAASVREIVEHDMRCFYYIFNYDFEEVEEILSLNCFSLMANYHSMAKAETTYNKSVSEKVRELASDLAKAEDGHEFFLVVNRFYKKYGVGKFGLNKAFCVVETEIETDTDADREPETDIKPETDMKEVKLIPITHTSDVMLSDLIGYEIQKKQLMDNTEAFIEGRGANNCLLSGDNGTGKSTCVKAILNQYYDRGLRMIELYKHQFQDLSSIIAQIKNRNYKFIIYMDDLSFEEFEIEYKYLKAVIEGGLEVKPDNVLIYATSNRRHLIRETWSDRSDLSNDELHRSDTMQEKLSLAARFGIHINFSRPSKKEFEEIVLGLAAKESGITLSDEEILSKANAWSVRNGGYSGRVAEQFITHLKSMGV